MLFVGGCVRMDADCHRCPEPRSTFATVRGASLQEIPEGSREPVSEFCWPRFDPIIQTLKIDLEQIQSDCGLVRCEQRRKGRCAEEEERGDRAAPQGKTAKLSCLDKCRGTLKHSAPGKRWVVAVAGHVRLL